MNKIKNWTKFNESNTYTYTLLNKNDEVVEIEADDIDDANRKVMDLYRGTDPMLTHMNGKLIDWNKPTANFGAMKESNGYDDDFSDEFDDGKGHIQSFNEHQEKLNISDVSDSEKIKASLDMIIDGFDYHFISKKYDTKEELEEQLKWFSDWVKKVRNKM
jgi:hypothetical protein